MKLMKSVLLLSLLSAMAGGGFAAASDAKLQVTVSSLRNPFKNPRTAGDGYLLAGYGASAENMADYALLSPARCVTGDFAIYVPALGQGEEPIDADQDYETIYHAVNPFPAFDHPADPRSDRDVRDFALRTHTPPGSSSRTEAFSVRYKLGDLTIGNPVRVNADGCADMKLFVDSTEYGYAFAAAFKITFQSPADLEAWISRHDGRDPVTMVFDADAADPARLGFDLIAANAGLSLDVIQLGGDPAATAKAIDSYHCSLADLVACRSLRKTLTDEIANEFPDHFRSIDDLRFYEPVSVSTKPLP